MASGSILTPGLATIRRGLGLSCFMAGRRFWPSVLRSLGTPDRTPVPCATAEPNLPAREDLKNRCLEIYDALVECSAFVNYRRRGSRIVIPRMTPDLVA